MNLTYAMAQSVNCAYLRLGLDVGLDKIVTMAKQLGITTPLSPYLSMSIGSEEVRPIDMAGVYATFADNGVHHTPYLVERVVDRNGHLLAKGGDAGTQVLSPDKAHEELQALRAVVTQGTGRSAALNDRPAWGKTGTAENFDNAWFDGFTPQLTTVVWMGSPIGNVPMRGVCGKTLSGNFVCPGQVFGASIPAPIWHEYMSLALANQAPLDEPAANPYDMGDIFSVKNPAGSFGGGYVPRRRGSGGSGTRSTSGKGTQTTAGVATTLTPPTVAPGTGKGPGGKSPPASG
jgi:penicillin-binding protein 1A